MAVLGVYIVLSPFQKPLSIPNGCKIQYLRYREKSFLTGAMAKLVEYLSLCLDLVFFTHFHDKKGLWNGLSYYKVTKKEHPSFVQRPVSNLCHLISKEPIVIYKIRGDELKNCF